ncbi:hypothetical protein BH10PLA1_BH10PLA1_03450 [soil metagenome]
MKLLRVTDDVVLIAPLGRIVREEGLATLPGAQSEIRDICTSEDRVAERFANNICRFASRQNGNAL